MPQGIVGLPRAQADSRAGRAVRTAVFAAVTLGLAVVAHRVAGGGREPAGFPVAFAGLLVLGWVLSRRERSGRVIALAVVTSQLALHLSFVLPGLLQLRRTGGAGGPADAQLSALLFCHHHGSAPISSAQLHQAAAGLDLSAYGSAPAGPSPTSFVVRAALMLLLHLVAAVVVAAWLRRGERAAWRHWVTVLRCGRSVLPVVPVRPHRVAPVRSAGAVVARFWFSPRALRGPPWGRAVATSF